MDTRGKSNMEFRNEVNETLARHESSFDQIHAALKTVITELQALRPLQNTNTNTYQANTNPFAPTESSHQLTTSCPNPTAERNNQHLKLSFPKFSGTDPQGWVYKAEQYFEFKNIKPNQ